MNMQTVQAENRKKVLKALQKARVTPSGGLKASEVAKRTKLCLRTVQTHLRALRSESQIYNAGGLWFAPNF